MSIHRSLYRLAGLALAFACLLATPAGAFEAHNPIEPPLQTTGAIGGLAVDLPSGNLYATHNPQDPAESTVEVFGPDGGAPAGGVPASLTGAGTFEGSFPAERMNGVAVDGTCARRRLTGSECTALDPSDGDVYVSVSRFLYKYRLNASDEYEAVCAFRFYGGSGGRCLATGGEASEVEGSAEAASVTGIEFAIGNVALDAAGDVYVCGRSLATSEEMILEFNPTGESLHAFPASVVQGSQVTADHLAVAATGTIYVVQYVEALQANAVLELPRSSLTGGTEGEARVVPGTAGATATAFDDATDQLFVDLGSSGEALNAAGEVVSRFGAGIMAHSEAIAVDEASGEVYAFNGTEFSIDRFGPGVVANLPVVDDPPPTLSRVARTSALLAGIVDTGDATTRWQVEYVTAGEYRATAANPYAGGGATAPAKLAAAAQATAVGPTPLSGLLAGTTYHYRLVASNELGIVHGPDHTFTTAPATPPLVTSGAASEVTQTGATLGGTVAPQSLQTSYAFEIGTDASYGGARLFGNAGQTSGTEPVSVSVQFLVPGVTYHYRLAASNEDGTSYGQDMTFTTPGVQGSIAQPPTPALISSPTVSFPSVAGAITKGRGVKPAKRKGKRGRRSKLRSHKRSRHVPGKSRRRRRKG
jgi:hypothetical protein